MSEERLHFGPEGRSLNAMEMAEHYLRYALAKPFVAGRRVLDIACGEGYGSWLMREWGAAEVVGVDVSERAIGRARAVFGRAGVEFVVGRAESPLGTLPSGYFDVVVCLETIEHVADPEGFLQALRSSVTLDGTLIVSCPNDHVTTAPEESNPYHLRKYTLQDFQREAESVLGRASGWYYGTCAQGYAVVPLGCDLAEQEWREPKSIVASRPLAEGHIVPSQPNVRPDASSAFFYVGVWGQGLLHTPVVAVSLLTLAAFVEPWKAIDWLKAEDAKTRDQLARAELALKEASRHEAALRLQLSSTEDELQLTRHQLVAKDHLINELGARAHRVRVEAQASVADAREQVARADAAMVAMRNDLHAVVHSRGYRLLDAVYYRHFRAGAVANQLRAVRGALAGAVKRLSNR